IVASAEVEGPQVVRTETTDAGMKMPAGSAGQDGEYGPTEIGDTLWEIALQVRPQGVSVNQAMIAIVEANPDAFINANVNQMLAGKVLALPSEEAYLALDNRQASAEFARQQQAWKDYKASAPQVAPPVVAQSEAGQVVRAVESHDQQQVAATATQGRVRLLAPADGGAGEGSAGSTTRAGSADEVSAHIQLLEENLDVQERENQALLEQISDLEKQLATLRSMLDVADTMASGAPVESADPTPAESAVKVEEPAVEPGDKQVGADEQPAGEASTDVPPVEGEEGSAADSIPTESGGTLSSEDPATGGEEGSAVAEPAEADEPAKVAADERPRPRPVAPTAPSAGSSWVDMVMDNLIYLAGLVLLVVLAVVGLAIRGGRKDKPSKESDIAFGDDDATLVRTPGDSDDSETAEVETAVSEKDQFTQTVTIEADGAGAAQPSEDTESFLDDFGGPGLGVSAEAELEDVDPIAEADVFLAYGHHEQAEEIILDAIQFDDRTTLKLKLLDIYFGQEKAEEYEQYAGEIRASVDDGTWERVAALGLALNPGSELFVGCTLDANEVGSL
ncbi:MAG: FimV/HubP family polar landmark protein, partial [Gammaproteobacteria bacterium]